MLLSTLWRYYWPQHAVSPPATVMFAMVSGNWPARTYVPPGGKNSRRRRFWPDLPLLCTKSIRIGFKRILVVDPLLTDKQASQAGVTRVNLDTLCREADFISLHAPLTPDTHHLIGEAELAKMKPSAVLVNTSRGGLIDEQALINALLQQRIFAAGLDVFESEPLSAKSPLLQMDNTLCTDHTAWFTEESVVELQSKAAHEVRRAFEGEHPLNWVNP